MMAILQIIMTTTMMMMCPLSHCLHMCSISLLADANITWSGSNKTRMVGSSPPRYLCLSELMVYMFDYHMLLYFPNFVV